MSVSNPQNRKSLFFSGVVVLTISNILIKAIGLMYKIPLTNLIGGEGMGYFSVAYSIYTWFYMISTAGLPIAISVMISESRAKGNFKEVKTIFRVTLGLFLLIGIVGMATMMFGSRMFATVIGSEPAYMCIIAIAPTLFFICISSSIRGFFQGHQNMMPTAISQVLEALGKLIVGILLAIYAINKGYELPIVAAYTIFGLTIGSAAGMIFLFISKILSKESNILEDNTMIVRSKRTIMSTLIKMAIPITISASVMSLTNLIDVMVVIRRLRDIGFIESLATEIYGNYNALAVPMFNLPPVLVYPISYAIIPVISAAIVAKNKLKTKLVVESSLKMASIISIPASIGMSIFSKQILELFFNDKSVEMAAPLLSVLALSSFFLCMLAITNAILQAYKYQSKPIFSMLIGSIVKLLATYILIGIPSIGMYGAPIGTFLCYLSITALNFYFLSKYVGIIPSIHKIFVKPLLASIVCMSVALGAYKLFAMLTKPKIATIGAIFVACFIYGITIILIKGIVKEDIKLIPKGEKIYNILHKMRLM